MNKRLISIPIFPIQSDLTHGVACNCRECPIARAINRALAGLQMCSPEATINIDEFEFCYSRVGNDRIAIFANGVCILTAPTPWQISRFIYEFDKQVSAENDFHLPKLPEPFVLVFNQSILTTGATL